LPTPKVNATVKLAFAVRRTHTPATDSLLLIAVTAKTISAARHSTRPARMNRVYVYVFLLLSAYTTTIATRMARGRGRSIWVGVVKDYLVNLIMNRVHVYVFLLRIHRHDRHEDGEGDGSIDLGG
jgi:hypothetical protein